MTEITPEARARQDAARVNGRFGEQTPSAPEIHLIPATSVDEQIAAALNQKAAQVYERTSTRALQPGEVVLTETNTDKSPFSFALNRSRELRRRWREAGMPASLTVLGRRRADEDGHTDDEVTFDLGGEPLVLTFHRDAAFIAVH